MSRPIRSLACLPAIACALLALLAPVRADEPWREISIGAEANTASWSVYSTSVWAPYGPVTAPGLRLRLNSSYGQYRYDGARRIGGRTFATRFSGVGSTAEALVGWQWQIGTLTAKLYGGIGAVGHTVTPFDPANEVQGYKAGAAGALELWWNVTPDVWASLDVTGASAFPWYGATARVGWRAERWLSLGIEGNVGSNGRDEQARIGALVRAEWQPTKLGWMDVGGGEATLAGGVGTDGADHVGAWARVGVLLRY